MSHITCMRKIIIIGALAAMSACSVDRNLMDRTELSHWSNRNDTIFHDGRAVGRYDASMLEWELYRGKQTMEMTIYSFDDAESQGLINYVHTKHRRDKVEIKREPRK
jgi:hypothetical protein